MTPRVGYKEVCALYLHQTLCMPLYLWWYIEMSSLHVVYVPLECELFKNKDYILFTIKPQALRDLAI